jgi:hypothetical protein
VTLTRLGGQLLDDERACVVPDCGSSAVAEPYQTTLPARLAELRLKVQAYERLTEEARAEADALAAEIEAAEPRAFICGGHRACLPNDVIVHWSPVASHIAGMPAPGRLTAEPGSKAEAAAIAKAIQAVADRPPRYREPVPSPPPTRRRHRAGPLAGV